MKQLLTISVLLISLLHQTALAEKINIQCSPWELGIDRNNGAWLSLKCRGEELLANPERQQTLNLNADMLKKAKNFNDQSFGEAAGVAALESAMNDEGKDLPVKLVSHHFDQAGKTLILNYRSGSWEITEQVIFGDGGNENRICRKADFRSIARQDMKFKNFRFTLFFPLKGDYFFPATFFTDLRWREDNTPAYPSLHWERRSGKTENLNGSGNDRIKFSILSPKPGLSLILFADSRLDNANVRYRRNRENLQADWRFNAQGWALPNVKQQLAGAYLEVTEKSPDRALRENCPQLLKDLGFIPPADRPEWVMDAAIYGLSNDPFHLSRVTDIPLGVMPRMKQLGLNTTWYRPSEASTGRYNPIDYKIIEPKIGNWAEYRSANEILHTNGIHVLQDLVPHGGGQVGFLLRGQSAALMAFTEQGNVLDSWSADFNNPHWLKYMGEICEFYTGDLKTDGFRIDAIYGSKTLGNWRKKGFPSTLPGIAGFDNQFHAFKKMLPALWKQTMKLEKGELPALEYDRASLASSHGGINMNRVMRNGAKRGNPNSAVLLESGELPFTACGDMHYDRDIQSCWFKLRGLSPEDFVKGLTTWLDEQQYVDAPGTIRMRYMETGVGESWPYRKWFGFEGDKAIRAMCTYIHGIPMVYETFTEGEGVYLNRILKIRQELKPLRRGTADYRAVQASDPAVFTVLRSTNKEAVVAAINFSPCQVSTVLTLPPDCRKKMAGKLFDVYAGKPVLCSARGELKLSLPPFGQAVVAALPELPAWAKQCETPNASATSENPRVSTTASEITIITGSYQLVIDKNNGLIRSFRNKNNDMLSTADLMGRGRVVDGKPVITVEETVREVKIHVRYTDSELVYLAQNNGVKIRAQSIEPQVLQLTFPSARQWELDSFEGMLADYRPENPQPRQCSITPLTGKQRMMMDPTLIWASSERPLDWNRPEIRMIGIHGGITVKVKEGKGNQYLFQAMDNRTGLYYLADFGGPDGNLEIALSPEALHQESIFGQAVTIGKTLSVSNESYGWKIANAHYELHLLRSNGVIRNLYAKIDGRMVSILAGQNLTAARGMFTGMPYAAASMDPETTLQMERKNGKLIMKFTGELRSAYALGPQRLRLITEYTFDDSPEIHCNIAFRTSAMTSVKPELLFTAERERFPKYLKWDLRSATNSGTVTDVSIGRNLKFKFFDGLQPPLLPRTDYRFALSLRTDGKQGQAVQPLSIESVPLKTDYGFEERCSLISKRDGRRILNLKYEYDEQLPWYIHWAAFAASGIGRDKSAGIYLSWPNPTFIQEINPLLLKKGKYRFSCDLKGELLRDPSIKAWSDKLTTIHPFLNDYTPFTAHIDYYTKAGQKKTLSHSWQLGKEYDWQTLNFNVDIPEDGYAPSVRLEAMPEYAGVIYLDNLRFGPVK